MIRYIYIYILLKKETSAYINKYAVSNIAEQIIS